MARIVIDGFEINNGISWYNYSGCAWNTDGLSKGFFSDGNLYMYKSNIASSAYAYQQIPLTNELFGHFRIHMPSGSSSNSYRGMSIFDAQLNTLCSFRFYFGDLSKIEFYRGTGAQNTTLVNQVFTTIQPNVPYLVQFQYKPHTSNGIFKLSLQGAEIFNLTGIQTSPSISGAKVIQLFEHHTVNAGDTVITSFDDLILDDSTWIDSSVMKLVTPTGSGNLSQFTVSGPNYNYQAVNESTELSLISTDRNYVYANQSGKVELYNTNASGLGSYIPKSIKLMVKAGCIGNSPTTAMYFILANQALSASLSPMVLPVDNYGIFTKIYETNPLNKEAEWTKSDIDNLQIGIKSG